MSPSSLTGALVPRAYLPSIFRSPEVDLFVSRVEIVQGTTMTSTYRVHIAGRATTLRIFVGLKGLTSQTGVVARVTRYRSGVAQPSPLISSPSTIYASINEGIILHTINFTLPSTWLQTGTSYVIELDPANSIPEESETNNIYPAAGEQSFNFVAADPLSIILVPIDYVPPSKGGTHYLPDTSRTDYLDWLPIKLFPVSTINYVWHSPYTWRSEVSNNGTGWYELLNAITALHNQEDNSRLKLYYGVINTYDAHGCTGGCVVGIGWMGSPTAVGFSGWGSGEAAASETMTHEMGHNFGRSHVLCSGNEASPDYDYPYTGGLIGTWGLDNSSSTLYDPRVYADYMSYCNSTWTSDYTYKRIFDFRLTAPFDIAGSTAESDTLYLGGSFTEDGEVSVLPLYRQTGLADDTSQGTHSVQMLDSSGKEIGMFRFTPQEIADTPVRAWGFHLKIPYLDGIAGLKILDENGSLLYERHSMTRDLGLSAVLSPQVAKLEAVPQNDGDFHITWQAAEAPGVVYRVRYSSDGGESWEVLALTHAEPSFILPGNLLSGSTDPVLEIQAVDGIQMDTQTIHLPAK